MIWKKTCIFVLLYFTFSLAACSGERKNIELLAANCSACHGTRGHSVGGTPSLAGLNKLHFIKQMDQFLTQSRSTTVMHHHVSGYTAEEIKLLADFFSKQK
jgi:cytochrome c553